MNNEYYIPIKTTTLSTPTLYTYTHPNFHILISVLFVYIKVKITFCLAFLALCKLKLFDNNYTDYADTTVLICYIVPDFIFHIIISDIEH